MSKRIRDEAGFGLVELLIAMTIMSIGIFAVVAGFSSSIETNRRASKASTAGAIADKEMEGFRRLAYTAIADPPVDPTVTPLIDPTGAINGDRTGPDGRSYFVTSELVPAVVCADGSLDSSGGTCAANGGTIGRPVKTVTVTVRSDPTKSDPATASDPVLIRQSSTFDQSTG